MIGYLIGASLVPVYEEQYKQCERYANEFDVMCKSVSIEEANKLITKRFDQEKEAIEHQKKLEIARAGRSINLYGIR